MYLLEVDDFFGVQPQFRRRDRDFFLSRKVVFICMGGSSSRAIKMWKQMSESLFIFIKGSDSFPTFFQPTNDFEITSSKAQYNLQCSRTCCSEISVTLFCTSFFSYTPSVQSKYPNRNPINVMCQQETRKVN